MYIFISYSQLQYLHVRIIKQMGRKMKTFLQETIFQREEACAPSETLTILFTDPWNILNTQSCLKGGRILTSMNPWR